jgi:hypothetical protein
MGTSRYRLGALRLALTLACLPALTFACQPQPAGAQSTHAPRAAIAKNHKRKPKHGKPKPKPAAHCKLGQARVKAGKRTFCVHNALPVAHSTPQAAAAGMALRLELGGVRDRRGRRSPSVASLLKRFGPNTSKKLEQTIATELARGNSLIRAGALTGHTAQSQAGFAATPIAHAAVKCGASAELERLRKQVEEAPPAEREKAQKELADFEKGQSFKSGDLDANLDLASGAIKLGIDLKAKGIRLDMSMRTCGEGAFQIDSCPTAEGKVKGSEKSEMELSLKVSEGAKALTHRSFKITGETTLEAQTGDDGKLDYYDIKHIYDFVGTIGGSAEKFGPVTTDFTYIGEARIDMRSASQKPPPAIVDVHMAMAGVDPRELIAAEIDLAKKAQSEADKEFSAVVEKATAALHRAEEHWRKANECVSIHFEPASETLTLTKGQTGTVKSRAEAKGGGAPQKASWTLSAQQNATFTPGAGESNPLSTSYTVTKAGGGAIVSATFKATSKAGVAEATWKQKTAQLLKLISGTFTGRIENQGSLIEWTGSATFERTEIGGDPEVASTFRLTSGRAEVTASGPYIGAECMQSGKTEVALQPLAIWTVERRGESFEYQIVAPFDPAGEVPVTLSSCNPTSGLEGTKTELALHPSALQSGGVTLSGGSVVVSITQTSPDGLSFDGSASEESAGESYSWSWSFKGST